GGGGGGGADHREGGTTAGERGGGHGRIREEEEQHDAVRSGVRGAHAVALGAARGGGRRRRSCGGGGGAGGGAPRRRRRARGGERATTTVATPPAVIAPRPIGETSGASRGASGEAVPSRMPATIEQITVALKSDPAGAQVVRADQDRALGTTPLSLKLDKGSA